LQWLKMQEHDLLCQRDEAVRQAKGVAINAYQVTSTGFADFPARARDRYPKLCASIWPLFTGGLVADAMFGTVGAAKNISTSSCQIQDSLRVTGKCASITSQQLFLMTSMQSVVATKVYQLQASLETTKRSIMAEHQSTFKRIRSAVWWSSLEQHWFSGPTDECELLFKKFRDFMACMTDAHVRMMKETKRSAMGASPHLAVLDFCRIC